MSADAAEPTSPKTDGAEGQDASGASSTVPDRSAGVTATSEANIAATDPNTHSSSVETPLENIGDVNTKAADAVAEGAVSGATVVAPESSSTLPSAVKKGKDVKRRSSGIPEHKSKKGGNKKKEVVLNLECEPGDYYFARMKGHPEWPAVIADEEMLPDPILGSRPVTARRSDYTYRDDFKDGGKNAKDRTYPVMFLGTNEFAWMINTDLRKLEPEDVEDLSKIKIAKKGLLEAYEVAQKRHGLDYFKSILFDYEKARAEEEQAAEEAAAAAEEKAAARAAEKDDSKAKKSKRKSTATVDADTMDVDDEDVNASKSSKKRKKSGVETDIDEKPAKSAKIKLNSTKATNGDTPKSTGKGKASKDKEKSKATPEGPARLSEAELKDKRGKSVLYLRHKLQKGFLQDKTPEEGEMEAMATHFETLQQYKVLEADIIRTTKIHRVLKAIIKLANVPSDDKYNFTKQSKDLLAGWIKILADEESAGPNGTANGAKADDQVKVEKSEEPATKNGPVEPATANEEDVSMLDVKADKQDEEKKDEPATNVAGTDAALTD